MAITNADKNATYIPIDLRYYNSVDLGNIIYTNIVENKLNLYLKTSKFSQENFILFNANNNKVKAISGDCISGIDKVNILRGDLTDSELVFNPKNSS